MLSRKWLVLGFLIVVIAVPSCDRKDEQLTPKEGPPVVLEPSDGLLNGDDAELPIVPDELEWKIEIDNAWETQIADYSIFDHCVLPMALLGAIDSKVSKAVFYDADNNEFAGVQKITIENGDVKVVAKLHRIPINPLRSIGWSFTDNNDPSRKCKKPTLLPENFSGTFPYELYGYTGTGTTRFTTDDLKAGPNADKPGVKLQFQVQVPG